MHDGRRLALINSYLGISVTGLAGSWTGHAFGNQYVLLRSMVLKSDKNTFVVRVNMKKLFYLCCCRRYLPLRGSDAARSQLKAV